MRVINGQPASFQESFTPKVKERLYWNSAQERECRSSAKGLGGAEAHGFQERGGLVTMKNKHDTLKQQCAPMLARRNRTLITQYS